MQNNFLIKSLKSFVLFFLIFAPCFSHAQDAVSNPEIMKEIEKSMIFDKESREKIDFYKNDKSKKKSSFSIKTKDFIQEEKSSTVDIVVSNENVGSFDLRQKEKLAYNAALVEQYEVAIELYKQVLQKEPKNNDVKFALATVYQRVGQAAQAKTLYYQLLKSDMDNQDAIVGNLLSILTDESPRDAVYLITRLSTQNPKSATILASAGNAYDKMKNYPQAISFFEKAIVIDPTRIDFQYNLAVIHDKSENYEKAISLYSQIIKSGLDDQSIPMDQIKKRVEFLRKKL
jgi:tetratricopeptide (TPR) repeat protein